MSKENVQKNQTQSIHDKPRTDVEKIFVKSEKQVQFDSNFEDE